MRLEKSQPRSSTDSFTLKQYIENLATKKQSVGKPFTPFDKTFYYEKKECVKVFKDIKNSIFEF